MSNSQFVNDSRGFSSSVASVLFSHSTHERLEQTKSGAYVYKGDASSFHEWEFRTCLRVNGVAEEKYAETVSKISEGLRGDAFTVVQELGIDKLCHFGDAVDRSRQANHLHEGDSVPCYNS